MTLTFEQLNGDSPQKQSIDPRAQKANQDYARAMAFRTAAPVTSAPAAQPTAPNPIAETGKNYMDNVAPAAQDLMGGGNIGSAVSKISKGGLGNIAGGVEDATLGVAKDAAQAIFAPIAAPIQTLISHITSGMQTPEAVKPLMDQLSTWAQAHPQIAKTLGDAFAVGTSVVGSGALNSSVSDVVQGAKDAVTTGLTTAKNVASDAKTSVMGSAEANTAAKVAKNTTSTISALDPELKGAKLNKAYKEVVTKDRTVTPSGLFTEQKLSPGERTMALGKRLSSDVSLEDGSSVPSIVLGKNPVTNLNTLKTALTDTETKLTSALKGDPEINFNADKQTLFDNLNAARDASPEEFRIGENKDMTKNVFSFANKIATKADDSIEGLRDARTAFDTQAKMEYPNAFNLDDTVNVRTAAGNAVKKARDVFNEHLYNTAPAGSDIQKLIGREADIFQATNPVAADAAKGAGKTIVEKGVSKIKDHPVAATVGGVVTGTAALKGLGL